MSEGGKLLPLRHVRRGADLKQKPEAPEKLVFQDDEGFPVVGGSCHVDTCNARDFLPFNCAHCKKDFCVAHSTTSAHQCEMAPKHTAGNLATICPECEQTIKYVDGEGAEVAALLAHKAVCTGKKVKVSNKCPVKGCKTKLTSTFSVTCATCGIRTCLTHRFEDAHPCLKPAKDWLDRVEKETQEKLSIAAK